MNKRLNIFSTYRFYSKFDYCPEDKLRFFLNDDWVIKREDEVLFIYNKFTNLNTRIIANDLLFTEMDLAKALCDNLILRNNRCGGAL